MVSINYHPKQVLILAPHPDDAELGCGGFIAKICDAGTVVHICVLSDRDGLDHDADPVEAAKILCPSNPPEVIFRQFPIFHLAEVGHSLLGLFEEARQTFQPDIVLCPALGDLHDDHQAVTSAAQRAFKGVTLLGYEIVRSNFNFMPQAFVQVEGWHVERKTAAVQCYPTQSHKAYCQGSTIEALARVRGAMCGVEFAEAFSVFWTVLSF